MTMPQSGKQIVIEIKSSWTGGIKNNNNRHPFMELRKKSEAAAKVCNFKTIFFSDSGKQQVEVKDIHLFTLREAKTKILPLLQ